MPPTFLRYKKFRFYVNSREETRMHVHIQSSENEAKVWLEPTVETSKNYGFNNPDMNKILKIVEEKQDEFKNLWKEHFRM